MAGSEQPTLVDAETAVGVGSEDPRRAVDSKLSPWVDLALLGGGVGTVWITLVVLAGSRGLVQFPLLALSAWAAFRGVDQLCKRRWGPGFDTSFVLCSTWLVLLVAGAVFADLLPLAEHNSPSAAMGQPVNLSPNLFSAHPLGTNGLGLDILARALYGARVSLAVTGVTVAVIVVVGGLIGLVAGYHRGRLDAVIGVLNDTLLAIPPLVLLIAFATVLGRPVTVSEAIIKMSIGLALVGLPTMIRLSRANTMAFAQREFVLAARCMGATHRRIILAELMPNVAVPLLSYASIVAALFILAEGSLSFLGLGLSQPEPTWGNMIAEGQAARTLRNAPHIALVPGAFMFLTIFSFNRVGEHFRGRSND